jgi:hypothetical protein
MKRLIQFTILIVLMTSVACKKAVQNKEEQLLMAAITDGQWYVQQYVEGATDVSAQFSGYTFQFYNTGKVIGFISSDTTSGTWSGDVNNSSITSQFPTAGDPNKTLNGTWILSTTFTNYVEGYMTTASGKNTLHLAKY